MLTLDISQIAMEVQRDRQFNQSKQLAVGDTPGQTEDLREEDLFLEETLSYVQREASPSKKEKRVEFESLRP